MNQHLWWSDYAAYTWERIGDKVQITLVADWWYKGLAEHLKQVIPTKEDEGQANEKSRSKRKTDH